MAIVMLRRIALLRSHIAFAARGTGNRHRRINALNLAALAESRRPDVNIGCRGVKECLSCGSLKPVLVR